MMNFREMKLNALVDKNTLPFKSLAGRLNMDVDTVFAILCEEYDKAVSEDKVYCDDDGWRFSTDFAEIKLVKNNDCSSSFERYLKFDLTGKESFAFETSSLSEIENFADFGRNTYLSELAALARPEKWHFSDEAEGYEILKNYIAYTFHKVNLEGKVFKSKDCKFAAFNTGLVSVSYDDIYMCFTGSGDPQNHAWKYAGICTTEKGSFHKHLISYCNPLPQPAQYIKRKEDVLYDMNKNLYVDFEHIILKRLHRIPLEFLKFLIPEALPVILEIENANRSEIHLLYERLRQTIEASPNAYDILKNALNAIVEKTLKILRWNYRLAIPSYFPTGDTMSLLLPMDFLGNGKPQAALVIQLTESDNYIGHTILSMKHSYLNARLIGSQESSWLFYRKEGFDMYKYCTRCGCGDIRKVSQYCGYDTFECEDCEYSFDIDDCYLEFEYDFDGRKDADEEDY